jgi:PAS domain S-box-containing protein
MDDLEGEIRELRRERDLLRALIDSTPHFFVAIDAEGKTRLMNPAMLEALGYREEEVIGTDYLQTFVPLEDRELLTDIFTRIKSRRQRTLNQNKVLTKEGQEITVEWHGSPMFDELGEFAYLFGIGTDVTERLHLLNTIQEREARYRTLLEHAKCPIILAAAEGEILDANSSVAELLGYDPSVIRRRMTGELRLPAPEDWPTGDGSGEHTILTELLHRDGSEVPVVITVSSFSAASRRCCLYRVQPR